MNTYVSETIQVKYKREYDLIVAGGGVSGCAAAIAASRNGLRVLVIEKTINPGGLATNGLVIYYNPSLCDQKGRKLIGGISEELLHASIKYGRSTLPSEWKFRTERIQGSSIYKTKFSAPSFIAALDEVLSNEKIDLLLDSVCCGVRMEDGVCKGVSVENKEGRVFYGCKQLVDTTGDLDLFKRAGAPCVEDLNWVSYWALMLNYENMRTCVEKGDIQDALSVKSFASGMDGLNNPPGLGRYTVETGEDVTEFVTKGRRYFLDYIKNMDVKKEMAVTLPSQAQYRTTRRPESEYLLGEKDRNQHHEDSVGCAYTHKYGGLFLEFPYRTLVVKGFKNMITAGRTIASEGEVRGLTRLIAPSAMTGEAAGTAASIAVRKNCDINDVPVDELQYIIKSANGIIHF